MVKTSPSNAGGAGSIPGWGAKIPHALWPKKKKAPNIEQEQYCSKFNKVSKTSPQKNNVKTRYLLHVTGYLPCRFP